MHSTNDRAIELIKRQMIDETPFLVLTTVQTQGRGQRDRKWVAAQGSLTFSLVLPKEETLGLPGGLPATVALCLCEAIEATTSLALVEIKWPNDIVVKGRKAGGILIESIIQPGEKTTEFVVIGVGLNVNNKVSSNAIRETSLMQPVAICEVIGEKTSLMSLLLKSHENISDRLSQPQLTVETYNLRSCVRGKVVRIERADKTSVCGVAEGIDDCGGLIIDPLPAGSSSKQKVISGTIQEIVSLH